MSFFPGTIFHLTSLTKMLIRSPTPLFINSLEPVHFVKKLRNTFYKVGRPLTLECTFGGSQRIHVSWAKDGKPVWASYKYNVKTTDSSSALQVLNSDSREAVGRYSCEISNSESSAVCHTVVRIGTAAFNSALTQNDHQSCLSACCY